jgi:hypothetical protein
LQAPGYTAGFAAYITLGSLRMKTGNTEAMPFTRASALQMLAWGASPESSPYTHKQIAEWCDRFWCQYMDVDASPEIEKLLPVLTDVETQWDLYLANTYSLAQLKSQNFEHEQMPIEWFHDWLKQIS